MSERRILTVIIRDDAPLIHCGSASTHRSVRIELTDEQMKQLSLWHKDETLSTCFIEPERNSNE